MALRIGIIDSGINPFHSHVRGVEGGVCLRQSSDGTILASDDWRDLHGHGTAVAGVIRQKALEAELYAIKVFDRELVTSAVLIAEAIRWAVGRELKLINLSLGTYNRDHALLFEQVCGEAADRGMIVIAPMRSGERLVLPGSLEYCIGVSAVEPCDAEQYFWRAYDQHTEFLASRWPCDLPGVPRDRNLNGPSFAVAHMTGFAARIAGEFPEASLAEVQNKLRRSAALI